MKKKKAKPKPFTWKMLYKEKRTFFMLCGFFILPCIYIAYSIASSTGRYNTNPIILAEKAYLEWNEGDESAWDELNNLFVKLPNLRTQYQGQLIQDLLKRAKIEKALLYSQSVFEGLKDDISLYIQFSKISLNITQCSYEKALTDSYTLKNEIDSSSQKEDLFFLNLYNLLRIAFLEKTLGHKGNELEVLVEIKDRYFKENDTQKRLHNLFKDTNDISLIDYVDYRKKTIEKTL